jgi:hypothetical protein
MLATVPVLYVVLCVEVCRLTRAAPTRVCHIPQALDYFLTEEMVERDAVELPHLLTWARSVIRNYGSVKCLIWISSMCCGSVTIISDPDPTLKMFRIRTQIRI